MGYKADNALGNSRPAQEAGAIERVEASTVQRTPACAPADGEPFAIGRQG